MGSGGTRRATRRRALIGAGAAGALAAAGPWSLRAPLAAAQRGAIGGGVAGQGVARTEDGAEASFSFFASRVMLPDEREVSIFGQVRWEDGETGTVLASTEVTAYAPVEGEPNARRLAGLLTIDGGEALPFEMLVAVAAESGGAAEITLTVHATAGTPEGADEEPVLGVEATAAEEDVQLLDLLPVEPAEG